MHENIAKYRGYVDDTSDIGSPTRYGTPIIFCRKNRQKSVDENVSDLLFFFFWVK